METLNVSFRNITDFEEVDVPAYIAVAVAHIVLVVIPCLILGPTVLFILVPHFKKIKDSGSMLFILIAVLCMVSPSTYGLLTDISLITNQPTFGTCTGFTSSLFWAAFGLGHTILVVVTALYSVVQYVTVRGYKRNLLKITTTLLTVPLVAGLVTALSQYVDDFYGTSYIIRGSICGLSEGRALIANVVGAVVFGFIYIPAIVVVFLFSILTYRHVKRNTIENGDVVKSLLKIVIFITTSVIIFRLLPVVRLLLQFNAVTWATVYSVELSYPLYLILIVGVHKTVRKLLKEKLMLLLSSLKKKPTQVVPSTSLTS